MEELLVMCHAHSHWLPLVPALQCIVQIQNAIKKLLQDLPKSDKRITANDKYYFIKRSLESKEVSLEIEILLSIKPLFDDFMTIFQKEEPMAHMLHNNYQQLLQVAMLRMLKSACFSNEEEKELTNINVDGVSFQLGTQDFKTMQGPKVAMLLKELPEGAQRKVILGMKSFYKTVIKDLQTKLPLNDEPLLALSYLGPNMQKASTSLQYCKVLVHEMPHVAPGGESRR